MYKRWGITQIIQASNKNANAIVRIRLLEIVFEAFSVW